MSRNDDTRQCTDRHTRWHPDGGRLFVCRTQAPELNPRQNPSRSFAHVDSLRSIRLIFCQNSRLIAFSVKRTDSERVNKRAEFKWGSMWLVDKSRHRYSDSNTTIRVCQNVVIVIVHTCHDCPIDRKKTIRTILSSFHRVWRRTIRTNTADLLRKKRFECACPNLYCQQLARQLTHVF